MYHPRITYDGDVLDYFGDVTTHTTRMETIKIHWNLVLSTPGAKYCTGNIANMYLMSLLLESEFVRFQYDLIPPCIIDYYNLDELVINGFVYANINHAWYGIKQGGKIEHDNLVAHLEKHGYVQSDDTDGLFKHITHDISFKLVDDDFRIKYFNKNGIYHLIKVIQEKYTFKVNFNTKKKSEFTLIGTMRNRN